MLRLVHTFKKKLCKRPSTLQNTELHRGYFLVKAVLIRTFIIPCSVTPVDYSHSSLPSAPKPFPSHKLHFMLLNTILAFEYHILIITSCSRTPQSLTLQWREGHWQASGSCNQSASPLNHTLNFTSESCHFVPGSSCARQVKEVSTDIIHKEQISYSLT